MLNKPGTPPISGIGNESERGRSPSTRANAAGGASTGASDEKTRSVRRDFVGIVHACNSSYRSSEESCTSLRFKARGQRRPAVVQLLAVREIEIGAFRQYGQRLGRLFAAEIFGCYRMNLPQPAPRPVGIAVASVGDFSIEGQQPLQMPPGFVGFDLFEAGSRRGLQRLGDQRPVMPFDGARHGLFQSLFE